ncbi:DUF1507 family protein [Aneurinibacillus tyrosinisolvens]|uniref:DUF1507 family protein n=1 Tax=Aneurinibacillus tyrosinisolvens TaxID=1443435 RepID=UPI00063F0E40|nr:DUF1507 family protein [Aneurinibacillus tyrosinisolvens]
MHINEKTLALLKAEVQKIERLIQIQKDNLNNPGCPVYEEVLDTQIFGLSRIIDFTVQLDLISAEKGKGILNELERRLV